MYLYEDLQWISTFNPPHLAPLMEKLLRNPTNSVPSKKKKKIGRLVFPVSSYMILQFGNYGIV